MSNIDVNELNRKLQYIFKYSTEESVIPIVWIDCDGLIVYHNKSFLHYIDNTNVIGSYIYDIIEDLEKDGWVRLWSDLLKNDLSDFTFTLNNNKTNKPIIFNIISSIVEHEGINYCYMTGIDITELTKLAESNFKISEETDKLTTDFLSNISHEIRTPMNAIIGFSEILSNNVDGTLKEYSKIIAENADNLLSLLDNIIIISRIDSEQLKIKYSVFDVAGIFQELYIKYLDKIKKTEKNLKLILDNNKNHIIETDKYIVEECLFKLLDNSIKFSNGCDIHFGYYIKDRKITIYVKDGGIGIENKYHEIIFDRFKQVKRQTSGSGLGLSIFKSYIKMIRGKYKLTSEPGLGTTVSFTIDLKSDKVNENVKTYTNMNDDMIDINVKLLKGKTILVAEDIRINMVLIHDILEPHGINIIECNDGKECIDAFIENGNVDIILMDLDMPYINGYEATEIIRIINKDVPIIAQTAYYQKEDRERSIKWGFTDFLSKPMTKYSLLKMITKWIK